MHVFRIKAILLVYKTLQDEEFVNKVLVPGLESGEPKYRVCLHYRDWMPGALIQDQIMNSVESSRRTLVVLSPNFIESVWGQLEFRAAHSKALQDGTNRIIVIIHGEVRLWSFYFLFSCFAVAQFTESLLLYGTGMKALTLSKYYTVYWQKNLLKTVN